MKVLFCLLTSFFSIHAFAQENKLELIKSRVANENDFVYSNTINEIIEGEKWGFHSGKIGIPYASSSLANQGSNNYTINNIFDLDLRTAWIEGDSNDGIGHFISFEFDFSEKYNGFGKPYNFYGIIEVFNGYCKSEKHWKENSRVKQLQVSLNEKPICLIELEDTWQYQRVDIRKFFKDNYYFPDAPYVISHGDVIAFRIMEIYEGDKYKDTAISEFVYDSPPN
ncbi:NADase-type glycan-binding domain-containing protein [Sediminitomix flava]|uniref:NAD glycohydrolase translocation F5/8 type C domain-containing protein n=1 Tax=Sediminitomix flava TaxID=379075 RepID=A0A315Z4A6_SEDFL|nr:hypothetical protein [Sediminitomix flava]PWJ37904.1 hypothetical protein BC781_10839 [Sediminitomix flava]